MSDSFVTTLCNSKENCNCSFLNEVGQRFPTFVIFGQIIQKIARTFFYIIKEKYFYGFCKTDLDCIVLNKLSQ